MYIHVHQSGSGRKGAVEAIRDFIPQPPGCRQGTSLAPVAWHNCPAAKGCGPSGLRTFGSTTRPRGRGGASALRRGGKRACVHALTQRARISHGTHGTITACTDRSRRARLGARRARLGHGAHAAVTARTVGTAGPAASATRLLERAQRSGWRSGGSGAAEGRSSVAGGVARGDGDFDRASGRLTSGRYQHSEGLRPGPRARRLSEGRPATRSRRARPQITAVTAPITTFAALITAIPVTWSGQRARSPRRRRPPRQRLSPSHQKA